MMDLRVTSNGVEYRVHREETGAMAVTLSDGTTVRLYPELLPGGSFRVRSDTGTALGQAARNGNAVWVHLRGRTYRFELARQNRKGGPASLGDLSSPMPGQVQRLLVIEGDAVVAGQPLLVVEAMKMQLEIKAPHAGTVRRLLAREAQQVEAGVPLVELEAKA
jgi:biotin carboxyl carrier protein